MIDIVGKKYNAKFEVIDDISKEEGGAFVIFNHLSRIDHFYVLGATYPRRFNMLAGYSEFFRSHLQFAFRLNQVIPKKQYYNDIQGLKAMGKILKHKGVIAFAPEGLATNDGMNKPIVPGTGKMLKHFKVPVYFCELRGQYLQNNKVCLDERYGETYATLKKMFSVEDLANLSGEQIDEMINEAFHHDDYRWQKEKQIKWESNGRICEKLHEILYKCPRCKSEFNMLGKGDTIKCNCCGNGAKMDDYYNFIPFDETCVIPEFPSDWVKYERIEVIKDIRRDPNYAYSFKCKIGNLPKYHYVKNKGTSEIVGEGVVTIDHNGFHYVGTRNNEDVTIDISYNLLYTLITEQDSSFFNLYINGEYFDFFLEDNIGMMKANLVVEEMHRLHVNFYKNFKWNEYMYEQANKELEEENLA